MSPLNTSLTINRSNYINILTWKHTATFSVFANRSLSKSSHRISSEKEIANKSIVKSMLMNGLFVNLNSGALVTKQHVRHETYQDEICKTLLADTTV